MRVYKTVPKTIKEHEELDSITCDLCGKVAKGGNWESSCWEVAEAEIEIKVTYRDGHAYPDNGNGTSYVPDVCPECFKNKLIPWFQSQGCTCKLEEWDY